MQQTERVANPAEDDTIAGIYKHKNPARTARIGKERNVVC
jgi:hypothetical protein